MLYNIIAPSPPPLAPPAPPPPPQPMMDFQRWCLAAAVLTGDQLLFAPIKQHLVDQRRMAAEDPLGREVMADYLFGETVGGRAWAPEGSNLQGHVADMYVYLREREATLTRKCKCLLYRSQQVFGFVGAPWTGAMDAEDQARAQAQGAAFLTSVGGALQIETRVESASFQRLELKYDELLLSFAFNFNLHPYTLGFWRRAPT